VTKASTSYLTSLALALSVRAANAEPDAQPAQPEQPTQIDLDRQYKRLLDRPHPRYLLPAVELFVAMSSGFTWYWIDRERQVADWDFPSIKQRFTGDAWKFDTNPFPINFAWHAYDGGQYHLFARANDVDFVTAVAYGFAMSLAWEFTVEFREQVSINDVIWTTASGTAIGEFVHELGRYFESAPQKRWWHPIPRVLLTTSRTAHNAIFGYDRLRRGTTPDHLGFSSDIWHRFVLSTGVVHTRIDGDVRETDREGASHARRPTLGRFEVAGDLAAIPGYLTAPVLERNFRNMDISSAKVRLDGGVDAFVLDFGVDAFVLGHHRQRFDQNGNGQANTIGVDLGFRYRRELIADYVQRLAQTHLPGLAFDHHLRFLDGDAQLRARVRANYDFVGVHALAYRDWLERELAVRPREEIVETSVVRKHKFYFGWGPSTRLDVMLETSNVSAGGSLGLAKYHSQKGYDREQKILTDDLDMGDTIVDWDAWLRIGSPHRRAFLEARAGQHRRENHVDDVSEKTRLTTFLVMFGTEQ
jgi:hypothetical protein